LEANAAFYRLARAPEFVLVQWWAIDDRLPASDDGPALREVLRRYEPVTVEDDWLLLRRRAVSVEGTPDGPALLKRAIHFNELVRLDELPPGPLVAFIDVSASSWGKLRSTLYKPPALFLEVVWQSGEEETFRLIPELGRAGFLLDPFPVSTADLEACLTA